MGTGRNLEAAADALLAGIPQDPEYPFLSSQAEARRRRGRGMGEQYKEVELHSEGPLAPVIRQPDDAPADLDAQWERVDTALETAGLTREERLCYLLHEWQGLPDHVIARLVGVSRRTAISRRHEAADKIAKKVRRPQ